MKNNIFKKVCFMFLLLSLSFVFTACGTHNKKSVLSNDVKNKIAKEENQIKEKLELGNKYLSQGKYDAAKQMFQKAVSEDRSNKDTYIKIKDYYVNKGAFDDAYYIINLAISNKVDINNMKTILDQIKKNFEVINLSEEVVQSETFYFPKSTELSINGQKVTAYINWRNAFADTSKAGTYNFNGNIEQYGREVQLTLNVIPQISNDDIRKLLQDADKDINTVACGGVTNSNIPIFKFGADNRDYTKMSEQFNSYNKIINYFNKEFTDSYSKQILSYLQPDYRNGVYSVLFGQEGMIPEKFEVISKNVTVSKTDIVLKLTYGDGYSKNSKVELIYNNGKYHLNYYQYFEQLFGKEK